jgi:hypothetical protein
VVGDLISLPGRSRDVRDHRASGQVYNPGPCGKAADEQLVARTEGSALGHPTVQGNCLPEISGGVDRLEVGACGGRRGVSLHGEAEETGAGVPGRLLGLLEGARQWTCLMTELLVVDTRVTYGGVDPGFVISMT